MNDLLLMRGVERVCDLDCQLQQVGDRGRFAGNALLQHAAFEELHRDEASVLVLADVVDRADVLMVEGGSRARFTLKRSSACGSRAVSGGRNFSATGRPSRVSSAAYTRPIPP